MPNYPSPSGQWFADQLASLRRDVAALKAQQTQFVTDASGAANTIIGNLANDPSGNATGLSGFGIAVKVGSGWVQVLPNLAGTWVAPTLINSWNVYSGFTVGYLKDPLGFVHMRGAVTGGTSGTVALVLPVGYRPGQQTNFINQAAGASPFTSAVDVYTNGNVQVFWATSNNASFDGITFLAEN